MIRCAVYQTSTGMIHQISIPMSIDSMSGVCGEGQGIIEIESSVSDATHYISNGAAVPFPVKPSPEYVWEWDTHTWNDIRTLSDLKETKWTAIKASRLAADTGNFTWNNLIFQINKINITGAVIDAILAQQAGETVAQVWRLADNTAITLNAVERISLGRTLKECVNGIAMHSASLYSKIYSPDVTTQAQLDLISWT